MHTFESSDGATFNYNSDMSGKVFITTKAPACEEFSIEGECLLEFVAEFIRRQKISKLEDQSWEETLGISG